MEGASYVIPPLVKFSPGLLVRQTAPQRRYLGRHRFPGRRHLPLSLIQPAILPHMRILAPFALCCLITATSFVSTAQPPPPPRLVQPDGVSVDWNEWLAEHGSTAVVLWGSWLPENQKRLEGLAEIREATNTTGLSFVVIALQEPIAASRDALGSSGLPWLHDRHGAMLKHLLVYQVPALVVIHRDGTVLGRLQVDSEALTRWSASK